MALPVGTVVQFKSGVRGVVTSSSGSQSNIRTTAGGSQAIYDNEIGRDFDVVEQVELTDQQRQQLEQGGYQASVAAGSISGQGNLQRNLSEQESEQREEFRKYAQTAQAKFIETPKQVAQKEPEYYEAFTPVGGGIGYIEKSTGNPYIGKDTFTPKSGGTGYTLYEPQSQIPKLYSDEGYIPIASSNQGPLVASVTQLRAQEQLANTPREEIFARQAQSQIRERNDPIGAGLIGIGIPTVIQTGRELLIDAPFELIQGRPEKAIKQVDSFLNPFTIFESSREFGQGIGQLSQKVGVGPAFGYGLGAVGPSIAAGELTGLAIGKVSTGTKNLIDDRFPQKVKSNQIDLGLSSLTEKTNTYNYNLPEGFGVSQVKNQPQLFIKAGQGDIFQNIINLPQGASVKKYGVIEYPVYEKTTQKTSEVDSFRQKEPSIENLPNIIPDSNLGLENVRTQKTISEKQVGVIRVIGSLEDTETFNGLNFGYSEGSGRTIIEYPKQLNKGKTEYFDIETQGLVIGKDNNPLAVVIGTAKNKNNNIEFVAASKEVPEMGEMIFGSGPRQQQFGLDMGDLRDITFDKTFGVSRKTPKIRTKQSMMDFSSPVLRIGNLYNPVTSKPPKGINPDFTISRIATKTIKPQKEPIKQDVGLGAILDEDSFKFLANKDLLPNAPEPSGGPRSKDVRFIRGNDGIVRALEVPNRSREYPRVSNPFSQMSSLRINQVLAQSNKPKYRKVKASVSNLQQKKVSGNVNYPIQVKNPYQLTGLGVRNPNIFDSRTQNVFTGNKSGFDMIQGRSSKFFIVPKSLQRQSERTSQKTQKNQRNYGRTDLSQLSNTKPKQDQFIFQNIRPIQNQRQKQRQEQALLTSQKTDSKVLLLPKLNFFNTPVRGKGNPTSPSLRLGRIRLGPPKEKRKTKYTATLTARLQGFRVPRGSRPEYTAGEIRPLLFGPPRRKKK